MSKKEKMMMKKWLCLIILFLLVGCTKNTLVLNEFINTAKDDGYIVKEDKSGYEVYRYIKNIYYAINRENAYDIQFIELESDDYAKKFFDLNKDDLSKNVNSNTYVKTKSYSDYAIYHVETDDEYLLVIRSKNNILYVKADINYINEIEEFLSDLDLEY